jgi:TRAP-type C4-dicarboxylate transport system substrate-binding protein
MTMLRSLAFAAGVAAALAGAPASAQVRWTLPSAYPVDNFHTENLSGFARDVAEATGGKLTITLYPNASVFSATAIKSAVRIGQAQAGEVLLSLHEGEDPMFGIDVVPFLAVSYEDARKLWDASRGAIEARLASQGLMALFAVPWPPQGIYSKREINRIADFKDLSLRAYNAATRRLAELLGAYPVTVQAADLPRALATGLINAFVTSSATGYDSKAWEYMTYFYDTQAWIPKNITFVNKAAFDALDRPTQDAVHKAAAAAEARGWKASEEKTKWYVEQLAANGIKVLSPSRTLKAGLEAVGDRLTEEWLDKAGADGQAVVAAYRGRTSDGRPVRR